MTKETRNALEALERKLEFLALAASNDFKDFRREHPNAPEYCRIIIQDIEDAIAGTAMNVAKLKRNLIDVEGMEGKENE